MIRDRDLHSLWARASRGYPSTYGADRGSSALAWCIIACRPVYQEIRDVLGGPVVLYRRCRFVLLSPQAFFTFLSSLRILSFVLRLPLLLSHSLSLSLSLSRYLTFFGSLSIFLCPYPPYSFFLVILYLGRFLSVSRICFSFFPVRSRCIGCSLRNLSLGFSLVCSFVPLSALPPFYSLFGCAPLYTTHSPRFSLFARFYAPTRTA